MILRFGRFTLDAPARQLTLDGREVRLPPKAFDLLLLLIERRPSVVDKSTLRERLWPGTHVVEASLSNLVAEIRALTGSAGTALVRTVHGVGYAFAGVVEEVAEARHEQEQVSPPCWLVWRDRLLPLAPGENLVGRDRGAAVWIDESGVSRRHACIRVAADEGAGSVGVTIEDLNSTNGTFVRGRAVTNATALSDGDKVRIGPEMLVFRSRASSDAPTRRVRRRHQA
jgi:DNA-binding winged helix-turn-helix (wHTH) protein